MVLGESESIGYKAHLEKRCEDDRDTEPCSIGSKEQCINQAKNKCNLKASCMGITFQTFQSGQGRVRYCYSSELETKDDWDSYMKSGPGNLQFYWTSFT